MSWEEVNIPCGECISLAICRHKYFIELKNNCPDIEQLLFEGMVYDRRRQDFDYRIYMLYLVLKPTKWSKEGATFKWKKRARVNYVSP